MSQAPRSKAPSIEGTAATFRCDPVLLDKTIGGGRKTEAFHDSLPRFLPHSQPELRITTCAPQSLRECFGVSRLHQDPVATILDHLGNPTNSTRDRRQSGCHSFQQRERECFTMRGQYEH